MCVIQFKNQYLEVACGAILYMDKQTELLLKGVRELEDKVKFMNVKLYVVGIISIVLLTITCI